MKNQDITIKILGCSWGHSINAINEVEPREIEPIVESVNIGFKVALIL